MVGLLGGDEASSAVALTQTYARRKWLGWYNSPGSYVTGERFRSLASSAKPNVVFDGDSESGALSRREFVYADPSALFDHEGWFRGPIFNGIYSGTSIQTTRPLASWLLRKATAADCQKVKGRKAQPVTVTVAILQKADSPRQEVTFDHHSSSLATVPIFSSLFTCIACGLYREWYALSMILLGILSRGFACLFIGSGDLVFDHPKPAEGSPPGDGILGSDQELVLLKGSEDAVNSVTRGRLFFRFQWKYTCRLVVWCSYLLTFQTNLQLIFVPRSGATGQSMFVVSWLYNIWLSREKADVEEAILKRFLVTLVSTNSYFPTVPVQWRSCFWSRAMIPGIEKYGTRSWTSIYQGDHPCGRYGGIPSLSD